MAEQSRGASYFHFDQIDWTDERKLGKAPTELVEEAERLGARRKRIATGEAGFHMQYAHFPPEYEVPPHTHSHDEVIYVLEGGCTIHGGPTLGPRDSVVINGGHEYGFTCGPEGMTFINIRTEDADTVVAD